MKYLLLLLVALVATGCSCRSRSDMRARLDSSHLAYEGSGPMRPIHFAFDSAALSSESKSIIRSNAEWLKRNGNPKVELAGYCDERGTTEYNLVLGKNRAQAALNYITGLGGDRRQFTAVSFGEENPVDGGHNEAAWAKNRRVEFVRK